MANWILIPFGMHIQTKSSCRCPSTTMNSLPWSNPAMLNGISKQ